MTTPPRWFRPVVVVALIWNLLGCAAYLADVTLTPADIAKMAPDQQALYAARPAWSVGATAVAVWGGAAGCLGLLLRKRWSVVLLELSFVGIIVQDVALFGIAGAARAGAVPIVLQTVVLIVGAALVLLARRAARNGWVS